MDSGLFEEKGGQAAVLRESFHRGQEGPRNIFLHSEPKSNYQLHLKDTVLYTTDILFHLTSDKTKKLKGMATDI